LNEQDTFQIEIKLLKKQTSEDFYKFQNK